MPKSVKLNSSSTLHDLDDSEQRSFGMRPAPVLIELPSGFQIYKWAGTSYKDAHGHRVRSTIFDRNGFASQYWAPWATMPQYQVPGFSDLRKRYANMNGSVGRPQEFARVRFAVTQEWSEMNSLVKAELRTSVWALLGVCAPQPVTEQSDDPRKVLFIGGNYQLLIPGLRADDIFQL
ncbi:MAG TPA: hypothetical protein VGC07_07760 [Granulicella sp.]